MPPVWLERFENKKTLHGEVGVLTNVGTACDAKESKCFLSITCDGVSYVGALLFDDPTFCRFVAAFLKAHIGEPIADIAALDVSESH